MEKLRTSSLGRNYLVLIKECTVCSHMNINIYESSKSKKTTIDYESKWSSINLQVSSTTGCVYSGILVYLFSTIPGMRLITIILHERVVLIWGCAYSKVLR